MNETNLKSTVADAGERALRELRVLYQASLVFSQSRDPRRVGQHIIDTLEQLLNYQRGSIWVRPDEGPGLEMLAHSDLGLPRDLLEVELARVRALVPRLGEGISGWVALHGKPIRTGDVKREPLYRLADETIESELCVPLTVGGRTIGALNVESDQPDAFSERDEQLLTTLANQAAIALENARFFHDLEAQLAEQKIKDAELRENAELLRKAQQVARMGFLDWDLRTDEIVLSDETCRIYGLAPGEIRTTAELLTRAVHPDDLARVGAKLEATLHDGRPYDIEHRLVRPDGVVVWSHSQAELFLDAAGEPRSLLGTTVDITTRKEAEIELEKSREELRALLARLDRAREEERVRISREVHDELGQLLTGLKMDVRWLERKLSEPGLPPSFNPLLDRVVAASELADATLAVVQKIAAELRPGALDALGLESALRAEARRFEERSGIRCRLLATEAPAPPSPEIANELFCIFQEAITNVARHADATAIEIRLQPDGADLVLEVSDDGVGLPAEKMCAPRSLGMIGMQERARRCGGTITFEPNEPRGTCVLVRVPGSLAPAAGAET